MLHHFHHQRISIHCLYIPHSQLYEHAVDYTKYVCVVSFVIAPFIEVVIPVMDSLGILYNYGTPKERWA
ncbi:hypothetical protein EMIT019CA3_50208 [Bacillus pseudomycoides]